ncbi:MAG: hypothetical protein JW850_05005 [Thermoflexales bacterium]|nr:hypothetical protein [Thermoflexales bacterium]
MNNPSNPVTRVAAEARRNLGKRLTNIQRRARIRSRLQSSRLVEAPDQAGTQSSPAIPSTSDERQATSNELLVNVRPEQVQAQEFYTYQLIASAGPQTRAIDPPSGEVGVQIPYDGFRHFPREAAGRLEKQLAGAGSGSVEGQAGWLALSAALDWAGDWSRPLGVETVPVTIPLRGEKLLSAEGWIADEVRAVADYNYTPDNLPFWPLSLDVQVCDDVPVPVESSRQGAWQMQPGQLVMDLMVSAYIPTALCTPDKRIEVEMERMELDWPTTAAAWQLDISQVDSSSSTVGGHLYARPPAPDSSSPDGADARRVSWRYNPDRAAVELRGVRARRGDPDPGSPLTPYRCHLRLVLRSPGQVIAKGELSGGVRLRLEGVLLSGREIAWIEATGYRRGKAGQKTLLEASFTAPLNQRLSCRQTMTCQRWYFPGISLSVDRMADIAAALHDLGYQVRQHTMSEAASGQLAATRLVSLADGELATLHMQLLAEYIPLLQAGREAAQRAGADVSGNGAQAETTQPRRPADKGIGSLVIHAQGQLQGPASIIALDLNRLMTMLKKRLAAVADTQ